MTSTGWSRSTGTRGLDIHEQRQSGTGGVRGDAESAWRAVAADRPLLLFAAAMSGSYVLAFQVYLALPPRARELFGERTGLVTGAAFALSGQLKLAAWANQNLPGPRAIVYGLVEWLHRAGHLTSRPRGVTVPG